MKIKNLVKKIALSSCLGKLSILGLLNYSLSTHVTVHFDEAADDNIRYVLEWKMDGEGR